MESSPLTQDLFYVCIRGQAARAVSLMADSCRGQIYTEIQVSYRKFQNSTAPPPFSHRILGGVTGGLESWPGEEM